MVPCMEVILIIMNSQILLNNDLIGTKLFICMQLVSLRQNNQLYSL